VRRETPPGHERSSVFTYLAPVRADSDRRGKVLSFGAKDWPIFPKADATGRGAYQRSATHGSLVKLYEYKWQGTKTNIVMARDGLLRRLDQGLPELALPVRLYECRDYRGHAGSFATNLLGLSARLDHDKAEKLEEEPIGSIIDMDGHKVIVKVFAFKKREADQYRTARNGVIFTINGQAHATLSIDFFRRNKVGMGYLAESLLVTVDCSAIDGKMREDLFMNSRDRLRDNALSDRLERELESLIKENPELRALRNRRREEELADKLSDDKPLAEALEEILKRSPTLQKLFLQGQRVTSPFPQHGAGRGGGGGKFQGRPFPTFFRFKGKAQGEELKRSVRLDSRARVLFETDAEDIYFVRDLDPAEFSVWRIVEGQVPTQLPNCRLDGPHSGVATLHLELPGDAAEGDTLVLDVEVTDISRVDPFVNRLVLDVEPPSSTSPGGDGTRPRGATTGNGARGTSSSLALPQVKRVYKADWPNLSFHTFTEDTALVIIRPDDNQQVFDFFVNVDNKYVRAVQKDSKENPRLLQEKFVHSMVLMGLALILDSQSSKKPVDGNDKNNADTEETIELLVSRVTTMLSQVILPMIDVVGNLSLDNLHDE
jgi:hypothetical protein